MRIGFLGPAQGDLDLLERSASFLLRERAARVVYLGHDGALDRCVVAWAQRLVGDDPTDDGAWSRAAEVAITGTADDLDAFVASERQRLRLRALVSLPEGSPCSLETLGDLTILMTHDAGLLSDDDLSHATLIVDGAPAEPSLEQRGNCWWLAPGAPGEPRRRRRRRHARSGPHRGGVRRRATGGPPRRRGLPPHPQAPSTMSTVAVFGGSFNPPHLAHVLAVATVLATHAVDKLLVVPTYQHPFAKPLAPYDERVAMCELAMGWLPGVEISRVEEELGGESKTLRTLSHLKDQHPDWDLRLVMGADLLAEAHKWFRFDEVKKLAPPIVLGRVGFTGEGAPFAILPNISSTVVRTKIGEARWDELASLVPRAVLSHIREKGLYGNR